MGITCISLTFVPQKSHAIIWTVIKAAAKKVIKAVDLQVQRLQNKTIGLQNAQKALENTMSKMKLGEISEWVEKQRKQYEDYYKELWQVRSAIAYYKRIRDIADKQVAMVDQYRKAYGLFQRDQHFRPEELEAMSAVYEGMLGESLKCLEELLMVINSFATEMSDAQRLAVIAKAGDRMDEVLTDLRQFNRSNALLSMQRAKSADEISSLRVLYDFEEIEK